MRGCEVICRHPCRRNCVCCVFTSVRDSDMENGLLDSSSGVTRQLVSEGEIARPRPSDHEEVQTDGVVDLSLR